MTYKLQMGLEGKAENKDMKRLASDKASMVLVEALVKRLNKIEERVMTRGRRGSRGLSREGSDEEEDEEEEGNRNDGDLSLLEEDEEEGQSDSEHLS